MSLFLTAATTGRKLARGATATPNSYPAPVSITNPGAETGDSTGWTVSDGSMNPATGPSGDGTEPHSGSYFWYPGSTSHSAAYQDVAVDSAYNSDIDAGLLTLNWEYYQSCTSSDAQRVRVEFYDGSSSLVGSNTPAYASDGGSNTWVKKSHSVAIPASTRTIRFINESDRNAGSSNDGYMDDLAASLSLT